MDWESGQRVQTSTRGGKGGARETAAFPFPQFKLLVWYRYLVFHLT